MKSIFSLALVAVMVLSCGNKNEFGTAFTSQNPVDVAEAAAAFEKDGKQPGQISGEIAKVCQSEGCWLSFKSNGGEQLIWFDHKFTVPKTTKGKAVAAGSFVWKEQTVEQLKEIAKDEGQTKEEIEKITEPTKKLRFVATGLKLQN